MSLGWRGFLLITVFCNKIRPKIEAVRAKYSKYLPNIVRYPKCFYYLLLPTLSEFHFHNKLLFNFRIANAENLAAFIQYC